MKILNYLKELITRERKLKKLSMELHTTVVDEFGFLIAVKKHSMEDKWGVPLLRHNSKDWYDLEQIKGGK